MMNNTIVEEKKIYLANPRGFCAGVQRAVDIVEKALEVYGAPLYVFHEIVHNDYVVESLRSRGVVFTEEIDDVPEGANIIFSAHGVSEEVEIEADKKRLNSIDASCPLVKKVHIKAQQLLESGYQLVLIGHKNHPEVIGTLGQVKESLPVVESVEDIKSLDFDSGDKLAYITQTTLSLDDTREITEALKVAYPQIEGASGICYATQNRQNAIKKLVEYCDVIFVIGSQNSSNSNRLKEVPVKLGVSAFLINSVADLTDEMIGTALNIGITAGASAPECLVEQLIDELNGRGWKDIKIITTSEENVVFNLPVI